MKVVLSGSGTLYPVHAGALEAIEEATGAPEALCGVSGGAIIAAARASGHAASTGLLRSLVLNTLPGQNGWVDPSWTPWVRWGLIKGDAILEAMREFMAPTFGETEIPLTVITSDLRSKEYRSYSSGSTPDEDLPLAVRKSMSIPFVFRHINFEVDGGVMDNFPLDIYGSGKDVVGLRIVHSSKPGNPKGLTGYVKAVVGAMMEAAVREHIDDAVFARTIILKVKGSGVDFCVDRDEALAMMATGYHQAREQLTTMETA